MVPYQKAPLGEHAVLACMALQQQAAKHGIVTASSQACADMPADAHKVTHVCVSLQSEIFQKVKEKGEVPLNKVCH